MGFLKARRFLSVAKSKGRKETDQDRDQLAKPKDETLEAMPKLVAADPAPEGGEDEDDDDFITNEVKRRLKELRKNTFMVLIPEEEYVEEEKEEKEESSSSGWRESDVGDAYPSCGFNTLYEKYTERMLFFDTVLTKHFKEAACLGAPMQLPKPISKRLALSVRNLSFKRQDELSEDCVHLQQPPDDETYQNLEAAYVAQVSLSWEALHCQYMELNQRISSQTESGVSYRYEAQAFQQFQVLLQRFIENEPFEHGSRVETYAHGRSSLSKFLQVPSFLGLDKQGSVEEYMDAQVHATELIKIMEESILTFHHFLKMDKKKTGGFFRAHGSRGSVQQVQALLEKKETKVKELVKKKKGWKNRTWPKTIEEAELFFALIDIKVISRVLSMARISRQQLLWCEEKMSKLDLSDSKLCRDPSPLFFPC